MRGECALLLLLSAASLVDARLWELFDHRDFQCKSPAEIRDDYSGPVEEDYPDYPDEDYSDFIRNRFIETFNYMRVTNAFRTNESAPNITERSPSIVVKLEAEQVTLVCKTNSPNTTVDWYFVGKAEPSSQHKDGEYIVGKGKELSLGHVTKKRSGVYFCRARYYSKAPYYLFDNYTQENFTLVVNSRSQEWCFDLLNEIASDKDLKAMIHDAMTRADSRAHRALCTENAWVYNGLEFLRGTTCIDYPDVKNVLDMHFGNTMEVDTLCRRGTICKGVYRDCLNLTLRGSAAQYDSSIFKSTCRAIGCKAGCMQHYARSDECGRFRQFTDSLKRLHNMLTRWGCEVTYK